MPGSPANALNISQAGQVAFDGVSLFTGSVISQFNVIVGGTANTLVNVPPSATFGLALISQGVASNPIFGSVSISGGGTGANNFTPFMPVVGGTTTTGALQSVVAGSVVGQVLTYTGASSLPTYQTAPAGVFSPNGQILLFDDFLGASLSSGNMYSNYFWDYSSASITALATTSNAHPGILQNTSMGAAAFAGLIMNGPFSSNYNCFILGGGSIVINWIVNIVTLSSGTNRYILDVGLGDTVAASDQVNGCYFEYSDNINSGNWDYKTSSASSRTTSTSSVAVTTGWHNLQITINAAGTSVAFAVDGASLGTAISTNIPTIAISPMSNWYRTVGTVPAGAVQLDLFYLTQTLTTPR